MDIFLKGLNIFFSTFCVCADGFQGLLFASMKLLSNFENPIGIGGFMYAVTESQSASCKHFQCKIRVFETGY